MAAIPAFSEVGDIVTANQQITLTDSAAGGQIDYAHDTHTIRVPVGTLAGGAADERGYLLFELHNARKKGDLTRAHGAAPPALPAGASQQQKAIRAAKMALRALRVEWEEWVNVAEMHQRAVLLNAALGAGNVTDLFAASYAADGAGWYLFKNYLADQITSGHTQGYDANAGNAQWRGLKILTVVSGASKNSVKITAKELTDWGAGSRKSHVKKANPFNITNETQISKLAGY